MKRGQTRRDFLRHSAVSGLGFWVAGRTGLALGRSTNEKLDIGIIGVGGQGAYNARNVAGENIVALCDVDERMAGATREQFPGATAYGDFRRMLDREKLDAVVVATPDHTHAVATMAALKAGKHVYCEKPLTHTVYEARRITETARASGLATQMGTQVHARSNYRRVVELVQTGAVGTIEEVHVWVARQWGGHEMPTEEQQAPEGLDYDLWLGPAPYRPYHQAYLPERWRSWWDFGGGTLADMGCHYIDLPFWALHLTAPTTIEAEGPPVHPASCPAWLIVRYTFPRRGVLPPVNLTWWHGGKRPPHFEEGKLPRWGDGVLFVGERGMLLTDYDHHQLLPREQFQDFERPAPYIPESIGHHLEWTEACKGRGRALCHFGYAGPLTETVLLGNVAYRTGRKLEWDAVAMKATNAPEADAFLRRPYRDGWSL